MSNVRWMVAAVVAAVLLGGCGFENPLTGWPSKDINTWLLGVWEHRDAKGKVVGRATVTPKTGDRYWLVAEQFERGKKKVYQFEAWISRVGRSSFVTLKCLASPGDPAEGSHVFLHYQLLDQEHMRVRVPQLGSPSDASGYSLREEVRAKLRDNTLFAEEHTDWRRVSEVHWSGTDEPQPFQPLRFPPEE